MPRGRRTPCSGHAALLPVMAEAVLDEARLSAADLDLVAVTVGPGSFTGIRAGLALAHGIALAAGVPVVGVTVGEALADSLPHLGDRQSVGRRSTAGAAGSSWSGRRRSSRSPLDALPMPDGKVAVAGDAAAAVAARLAARDVDVMLTDARLPMVRHVAVVAERRFGGTAAGARRRSRSMSIRRRRGCRPAGCGRRRPDDRADPAATPAHAARAGGDPCRGVSAARGLGRGRDLRCSSRCRARSV